MKDHRKQVWGRHPTTKQTDLTAKIKNFGKI
jgi:hypothetical protein